MSDNPQSRVLNAYHSRLSELAAMKGRRNASLLGLCTLGIRAGLSDTRLEQEIRDASGTPPLGADEIRRAINRARRDTGPLADRPIAGCRTAWRPAPKPPPPLGPGARTFVARMIAQGTGADSGTLAARSPLPIPDAPASQTVAFLETLYAPGEYLFCGDATDKGKIGANILTAGEWAETARAGKTLPPLLIGNPLTGRQGETTEGKPSYRCAACVEAYRYALIEFDALPLPGQCAFWQGVITSGILSLRALTYSGSKSIHGLVELNAADREIWERQSERLFYATCNPDAPERERSDRACRNPDRMTRLPGAFRPDKGRVQSLLWLRPREHAQTAPVPAPVPPDAPDTPQPLSGTPAAGECADRCRDCWNWTPDGFGHGCAAGIRERPSPDWRGPCAAFDAVM